MTRGAARGGGPSDDDAPAPREAAGPAPPPGGQTVGGRTWTFLTNHGHLLVALNRSPDARLRDLAQTVGITERAAQNLLADLEREGYVTRTRVGRRNTYRLHPDRRLRHPAEADHRVGELLGLFGDEPPRS